MRKTNSNMLVFFMIPIWVLTILALPIRVGVEGLIDFFGNDGHIKVQVFGFHVFSAGLYFEHDAEAQNNIVIKHGKKADKIHINNDPKDKKSIMRMIKNPAAELVMIEKLDAHFLVGKNNDAFFTTMLLGAIRSVFFALGAFLKSRQNVQIIDSFTPEYNNDALKLDFIGIISVSIADIICSLLGNKFRKAKVKIQEVQKA